MLGRGFRRYSACGHHVPKHFAAAVGISVKTTRAASGAKRYSGTTVVQVIGAEAQRPSTGLRLYPSDSNSDGQHWKSP